jgi:hypothetical protein
VELVASIPRDADVAAVFGRARDFEELTHRPTLDRLWVSGVREREFEILATMTWLRSLTIHDLRVATLRSLSTLVGLKSLRIAGSPRIKSLDGLEELTRLNELILFDCCNYSTVAQIKTLIALDTLCLEGGFSKPLRIDSLAPLSRLMNLRRLRLASIRVADKSLRALHGLHELRDVFIAKMFPDSELQAAAYALPLARGEYLESFRATRS